MNNNVNINYVLPPLGARAGRLALDAHGPNVDYVASSTNWSDVVDNDELCDVLLLLNDALLEIPEAEQVAFLGLVKYTGFNAQAMLRKLVVNFHRFMAVAPNRRGLHCDTLKSFQGAISACVLLVLARGGNVEKIGNRTSEEGREVIRQLTQMFDLKSTAAQAGSDGATLFRIAAMMPHVCAAAIFKNRDLFQLPRTVARSFNLPKGAAILVCPGAYGVLAEDDDVVLTWNNDQIHVNLSFVRQILANMSIFLSGASSMFLARRMNKPIGQALDKSIKGLAGAATGGETPFRAPYYFELMNNKIEAGATPMLKLIKYENNDDVTDVSYYFGLTAEGLDVYNDFRAAIPNSNDLTSLRTYPGWEVVADYTAWDNYNEVAPYINATTSTVVLTPN